MTMPTRSLSLSRSCFLSLARALAFVVASQRLLDRFHSTPHERLSGTDSCAGQQRSALLGRRASSGGERVCVLDMSAARNSPHRTAPEMSDCGGSVGVGEELAFRCPCRGLCCGDGCVRAGFLACRLFGPECDDRHVFGFGMLSDKFSTIIIAWFWDSIVLSFFDLCGRVQRTGGMWFACLLEQRNYLSVCR